MLAAVNTGDDRYENLRNYVLGNKRAPPQIPEGVSSRPRLEAKPGSDVPGIQGKIPTSSQRPGKQTNQKIVYGRMVFTEFEASAASPSDIFPGDVVLVQRTKNSLGHDTNRASKVASTRQINGVLQGNTAGARLDETHKAKIVDNREKMLKEFDALKTFLEQEIDAASKRNQGALTDSLKEAYNFCMLQLTFLEQETDNLKKRLEQDKSSSVGDLILPYFDWRAVPFLSDWSPDGVLLSRDDDEYNSDYFKAGGGDSGTLLNVVLQGPTFLRNATQYTGDAKDSAQAQLFDSEPRPLDDCLLLLLCKETLDANDAINGYTFAFKLTSRRILEELGKPTSAATNLWEQMPDRPYPNAEGLTFNQAKRVVASWRIGKVMDSNVTNMTERKVTLNVAIEAIDVHMLTLVCGDHVGSQWSPFVERLASETSEAANTAGGGVDAGGVVDNEPQTQGGGIVEV